MPRPFCVAVLALLITPLAASAQSSRGTTQGNGPNAGQAYFEFQVEKPAMPHQGNPRPVYPSSLLRRHVTGEVLAQFVVDTTGKADVSSFELVRPEEQAFVQAVKAVLPRLRFYPAEVSGHKVRQLVQQSFLFVAAK
ncbi:MAG TPA: energy transducer TonB [Gemmatimonadaceae bacterium]|nr:energy transducer TonB [Gemmatimonadaceae bacterium]